MIRKTRQRGTRSVTALWRLSYHVVVILVPLTTLSASQKQLKEGNRQFKNGHYEKALESYQDGLIDTPYSSVLQFNAGDANMMMGEFPKAEVSFTEAAKSANPILRGGSHYNRGNALFYQGKYVEAIEAYKDSLRANPSDEDAKYNLGVALKAKNNPPPPKSGSKGASSKDPKSGDKKDQNQANQPKPGQMSKEDAERLLSAAGASEKKKGKQQGAKQGAGQDEDW